MVCRIQDQVFSAISKMHNLTFLAAIHKGTRSLGLRSAIIGSWTDLHQAGTHVQLFKVPTIATRISPVGAEQPLCGNLVGFQPVWFLLSDLQYLPRAYI